MKRENLHKPGEVDQSLKIQYDYMNAYFDFFTGEETGFKIARKIVSEYEDYPVLAWRVPFLEMLDQLYEYDGKVTDLEIEESKMSKMKKKIKQEQILAFEINEKGELAIEA